MKIGILGSGMVGQTLAAKLAERGQDVMVSARSPEKVAAWAAGAGVKVGSLSETAAHGEIVINATKGEASVDALRAAGEANLAGKILIDIANPLDFSRGMPPTLWVSNTDSLGEQIQRAFPQVEGGQDPQYAERRPDGQPRARWPVATTRSSSAGTTPRRRPRSAGCWPSGSAGATSSTWATSPRRAAPSRCCRSGFA